MGYTRCVDCNDTISPDITTPVSVFHHSLQPTVPSFHHSFTISALAFHQTWHLQPLYFTISCNLLCPHFTTPLYHPTFYSSFQLTATISCCPFDRSFGGWEIQPNRVNLTAFLDLADLA